MKKATFLVAVVAFTCFFGGCASIISGTHQNVNISSTPHNARVVIYNASNARLLESITPAAVDLKRGRGFFRGASYRIEISKDGYETQVVEMKSSLNGGWYIGGNILLVGGFIGILIVDPLTGAMWALPKNVSVDLRQNLSLESAEMIEGVYIVSKDQIPDEIFNDLELVKVN
ncbi:MAG: hypothetical protein LBC70_01890 [Chitinispirillales bacterium]|jgi:hypothetical protein|nr:hypothetical protein [Chitinispirillales bacterium]